MGYAIFEDTIANMTWVELERAIHEGAIFLLPTGVIEEHGPHLSLGTDAYTSWWYCTSTRQHLEAQGIKTLIVPPCYWGINQATGAFPGSFTVQPETFKALLLDIFACLKTWGARHVFTIDGHGDPVHERVILDAVQSARETVGIEAYFLMEDYKVEMAGLTGREAHIVVARTPPVDGTMPQYAEVHAGAIETGMMKAYFPGLVDLAAARALAPTRLTYADIPHWQQGGEAARAMTPLGYFGSPAEYERDLEEVRKYFHALPGMYAEAIAAVIKHQGGSSRADLMV